MTLPRRLKLTFIILLLAAVGAGLTACNRSNGQGNSASASASPTPAAIQISTTSAVMRQLPRFFEANGSLAPNQQADVAAETSGKVAAVGVDMGSTVRRGQMIVKLDDADFRIKVQQAQAQLDQRRQRCGRTKPRLVCAPARSSIRRTCLRWPERALRLSWPIRICAVAKNWSRRATSRARPMTSRNHKGISWLSSIRR